MDGCGPRWTNFRRDASESAYVVPILRSGTQFIWLRNSDQRTSTRFRQLDDACAHLNGNVRAYKGTICCSQSLAPTQGMSVA